MKLCMCIEPFNVSDNEKFASPNIFSHTKNKLMLHICRPCDPKNNYRIAQEQIRFSFVSSSSVVSFQEFNGVVAVASAVRR